MSEEVRLNLGSGKTPLPGYDNLDIGVDGRTAFPLAFADAYADEIRASHLLEHFSHRATVAVLADWVRVLKPGGVLKVAVPNFDYIVDHYKDDSGEEPLEAFLMGGHSNDHDVHLAIFNEEKLRAAMQAAGLIDVQSWASDAPDCSALPVSLNLCGRKPAAVTAPSAMPAVPSRYTLPLKVAAVMSVPRLGFMDNFFCAFQALMPLRIPIRKHTGAYWEQCIERAIMESLEAEQPDLILTLDYDTIFTAENVAAMVRIMAEHPEIDALAPLQASRSLELPMMTVPGPDGAPLAHLEQSEFAKVTMPLGTAHFGCTLLRASALRACPHPWFCSKPGKDGTWTDHLDADIAFWKMWAANKKTLHQANRVVIGHCELMIRWPGKDLKVIHQVSTDFFTKGKPEEAWS